MAALEDSSWNRLQDILDQFEEDCQSRYPRPLKEYLPGADDPLRPALLLELVRVDLELSYRHQQGKRVEEYVREFPELANPESLEPLVVEEFAARIRAGLRPKIADCYNRFPAVRDKVSARLEAMAADLPPEEEPHAGDTFEAPLTTGSLEDSRSGSFPLFGPFKKMRRIGRGSFGEVWEAQAPGGVPVAVKRIYGSISPQATERERKSLDLICSGNFRHPFLLQVFGWWVKDERLHIAMELADESLADRLKQATEAGEPGLSAKQLRQVMLDSASALDFLNHERNILHRDIKPANLLLMAGRAKLADFGLSRALENLAIHSGRTFGAGTPMFMPPEILHGFQSKHSDQYALAATYYHLRTGCAVYPGKLGQIRRQQAISEPKLDHPSISARERRVLLQALARKPEERFPNSMTFVEAIEKALRADREDAGDKHDSEFRSRKLGKTPPDPIGGTAGSPSRPAFTRPEGIEGSKPVPAEPPKANSKKTQTNEPAKLLEKETSRQKPAHAASSDAERPEQSEAGQGRWQPLQRSPVDPGFSAVFADRLAERKAASSQNDSLRWMIATAIGLLVAVLVLLIVLILLLLRQ